MSDDRPPDPAVKRRLWIPPLWMLSTLAILSIVAASYVSVWLPWQHQVSILEEISSHGGHWEAHFRGPDWLQKWIRGTFTIGPFDHVTKIRIVRGSRRAEIHPEILDRIAVFGDLEELDLSYTNVTDDWMPKIAKLESLRELKLRHCRICGRGFGVLASLSHLEKMSLTYCPIRDEFLSNLERIPHLQFVNFAYCSHLTADGVAGYLSRAPSRTAYLLGLKDVASDLRVRGVAVDHFGMTAPLASSKLTNP